MRANCTIWKPLLRSNRNKQIVWAVRAVWTISEAYRSIGNCLIMRAICTIWKRERMEFGGRRGGEGEKNCSRSSASSRTQCLLPQRQLREMRSDLRHCDQLSAHCGLLYLLSAVCRHKARIASICFSASVKRGAY